MSSMDEQETGCGLGDDRNFFEEDFVNMLPGSWMALPAGFDVTVSRATDADAVAIKAEDVASSYFGFVPRQQLDGDATKGTIAALHERGIAVTLVEGKTKTSIDAVAYQRAVQQIDGGARHPYEDPENLAPEIDWAHAAVRGILHDLTDTRPYGYTYLNDVELRDRVEIVRDLADVVRAAFIRRAA